MRRSCSYLLVLLLVGPLGAHVMNGLEAVQGDDVLLPCRIDSPEENDVLHLVLFFRQSDFSRAVFSFDARGSVAKKWASNQLNQRGVQFNIQLGGLQLTNLTFADEGLWHCRTEFDIARSQLQTTNLSVLETVSQPAMMDTNGRQLQSLDGVFNEDQDLLLFCQVNAGKPMPSLQWYLDAEPLTTGSSSLVTAGHVTSRLHLERVSGDISGSNVTCVAKNSPLTTPMKISLQVTLNLKPKQLEISGGSKRLGNSIVVSTVNTTRLTCSSFGSRPPAEVTWWKGTKKISAATEIQNVNETYTVRSTLEWDVVAQEDGLMYRCQVTHRHFPNLSLEERIWIDVLYPPIVQIRLQNASQEPSSLPEGSTVTLICDIQSAKPAAFNFTWFYEGQTLSSTLLINETITISDGSLVLHRVGRTQGGLYSCAAANSQGVGHSRPLFLKITHIPVCRKDMPSTIAIPHSAAHLRAVCSVEAEPPIVHYWWTYEKNPGVTWNVPAHRFSSHDLSSELLIPPTELPESQSEPGTLLCWARNPAGMIQRPCRIKVMHQGLPEPVQQCSITDAKELRISCIPGFDGGSPATYVLNIFDKTREVLRLSNSRPEFIVPTVTRTSPVNESDFEARIVAINSYGQSNPVFLKINKVILRLLDNPNEPYAEDWVASMWPWVGIAAGAAVSLAAAGLAAAFCRRSVSRSHPTVRPAYRSSLESVAQNTNNCTPGKLSTKNCIGKKLWNETSM